MRTVCIISTDTDFAKKAAEGAHDNAIAMGFEIVYERSYPPTTVDFNPIIRRVQAANPDIVYVASYPLNSVGIVRAANEIKLKAKLFGGNMVGLQYAALKTQLGAQLTARHPLTPVFFACLFAQACARASVTGLPKAPPPTCVFLKKSR